jgi:hypothetical protein
LKTVGRKSRGFKSYRIRQGFGRCPLKLQRSPKARARLQLAGRYRPSALSALFPLVGKKGRRFMENWKSVSGYEGMYEVSDCGRVRGVDREVHCKNGDVQARKARILKQKADRQGYYIVCLCKCGKLQFMRVHRLVGYAFIENPENKPEINHIDENTQNNCVTNLEWCTRKENVNWGTGHQRGVMNTNFKAFAQRLSKKTAQLSLDGKVLKVWDSLHAICRETGYKAGHISECCHGKKKSRYGYRWSFVQENGV